MGESCLSTGRYYLMSNTKLSTITKRDGRKVPYNLENIAIAIWKSLFAVQKVRQLTISNQQLTISQQAAGLTVPEDKLDRKSRDWREANRLTEIVEQILIKSNGAHQWKVEEIQDVVEQTLLAAGHQDAARAYILYRNRRSAARLPSSFLPAGRHGGLRPSALDDNLGMSENAYAAMAKRYLWKDKDGNVIETPKQAFSRVATAVAASEKVRPWRPPAGWAGTPRSDLKISRKYWRDRYLEIMTSFEFTPAGCYFRGAGNKHNGSLANCFVLPVEDSIEEIFQAVGWAARIHQLGGGVGYNFSHLRPRGDVVKSGGLASGPINFMKAFDAETEVVMQGGEHRGANMGILNVDHPDIFEFIRAKSVDGEVSNFNISVGAFDKFMRAVEKGADWGLINPRNRSTVQKIPARSLWNEIITLAHATGDPGMIYLDTINKYNPLIKKWRIDATNVCGEQPLFPFDVCNLGSINLSKFVIQPWWKISKGPTLSENINWSRLEFIIRTAVRFLDDGIDASTYPIPQIENMAHKLRRIGLGVMGWADMLAKLGVRYDSDEGVKLAESTMKFIQQISWDESEKLAKEKAVFPLWKDSYFNSKNNPFGRVRKVRNVAVTTIAPTGTISMIADCSSGIEPYFALEYTKNVVEKQGLKYTNKYYDEAKRKMPGTRHQALATIFRTAHEISPDWHVKMQAAFQKFTDNAVSKTINFSRSAAVTDVEAAYLLAWKLGCKGITVYRDGSRENQILKSSAAADNKKGNQQFNNLTINNQQSQRLMQSQMAITPLSQRAYKYERQQIIEESVDGHCPKCGSIMEETEGCSLCRQCGYSRCSL